MKGKLEKKSRKQKNGKWKWEKGSKKKQLKSIGWGNNHNCQDILNLFKCRTQKCMRCMRNGNRRKEQKN